MQRDDFFFVECVGKGLFKLTLYGKSTTSQGPKRLSVEVIIDDDDIDGLLEDIRRARRNKVTISSRGAPE